jgi:cyclopropane-fatty-acyl-phospholipid synthase
MLSLNFARQKVLNSFKQIKCGQLNVIEGKTSEKFGFPDEKICTIHVINPEFYRYLLMHGSIGAAESFMKGHWETDNLTLLLRLFLRNQALVKEYEKGFASLTGLVRWFFHQLQRNNIRGSKKNIGQHYDLSNEFFELFLDKNMMYSSALFPEANSTLDEASDYKLDTICQKLDLKSTDNVIEIGSGWGGFALHAAKNYGCKIVTTTISDQQYAYTAELIRQNKLTEKITLIKKDYRHLTGKYNKLVSIEMIEAVGHQYYRNFFKKCGQLLEKDGQMLIQAITIQDQAFNRAKHEIDFIKRYIFPGSCIPSITAMTNAMTQSSDLKLFNLQDIGFDYAKTLSLWRKRFLEKQAKIRELGFDEAFIRMWNYYFSYCEAGFAEGYLGDIHFHCVKPSALRL